MFNLNLRLSNPGRADQLPSEGYGHIRMDDTGEVFVLLPDGSKTPIGGGDNEKLVYGVLSLSRAGQTPTTQSQIVDYAGRSYTPVISDPVNLNSGLNPDYSDCFIDIYDGSTLIGEGLQFTTIAQLYAWLSANASVGGGQYNNACNAVFYDKIDYGIKPISKVRGVNMFYSVLRRKNRYNTAGSGNNKLVNVPSHPWSGYQAWIQDVVRKTGVDPTYTYNVAHDIESCFHTPASHSKLYGQFHSIITFKDCHTGSTSKRMWNPATQTSSVCPAGMNIDLNSSVVYRRDVSNQLSFSNNPLVGSIRNTNIDILTELNTMLIVYVLDNGSGQYSFYVKPLGIDTLYLDYFDWNKYDLYRYEENENRYGAIKKIAVNSGQDALANSTRLQKDQWFDPKAQHKYLGSGSMASNVKYKFFLRDKTTKKISALTRSYVELGVPKRNTLVNIRVVPS